MQSATAMGSPATASIQLKQLVYPLHGAEFAVGDLASAHGFGSLGTHCCAVGVGLVGHDARACGFHAVGLGFHYGFGLHFSAGAVRVELQGKLRAIGFVGMAPNEAKAATAAMERKRAVLFMMKILESGKKRLKKAGSKTIPEPGSVSRLAGSAHRWVELYADGVHGKTTQSQTNCFSIENNRRSGR